MHVLVLLVASGCVLRDDIVHVTVRDPALIAVHAPHGAPILAAREARADIPASVPPYVHDPVDGSWLERTGDSIDVWCPACRSWRRRTILDSPVLVLAGTAAEVVRFDAGMLHARSVFDDTVRTGRRRASVVPRIELDLVTPVSNVVAIDYESHVSDRNGGPSDVRRKFDIEGAVFGAIFALGGAALTAYGIERGYGVAYGCGSGMIVVGGAIVGFSWHELAARDEHTAIAIPRGSR